MSIPDDVLSKFNKVQPDEPAHQFELDLTLLVTSHVDLTMKEIRHKQNDFHDGLNKVFEYGHDPATVNSFLFSALGFYDEIAAASRNLATVALVTRLEHWASLYARRLDPTRERGEPLRKSLAFLDATLGTCPEPLQYFLDLAEVRHSVIHADSQPTWDHKGIIRKVADRYIANQYRVELTEADLEEAVHKAIEQIKWYDRELKKRGK